MYVHFFKRFIDFWIALLALIILSPLLLFVTIALYIANEGAGAFFVQSRPGKNGKVFNLIKFKSMNEKKDENGNLLFDTERLTKSGKFIRKTSIDELPQLINVLKGDMALIGPRPLLLEYYPYYTEREQLRHKVRPGITGYTQVKGRNKLTEWAPRLEMDVYYVENISFLLDLKIFFKTVKNVYLAKDITIIPGNGVDTKLNIQRGRKFSESITQKTSDQ